MKKIKYLLFAVALATLTTAKSQLMLNPTVGQSTQFYYTTNVVLADTGAVGNAIIWDFSNLVYNPAQTITHTYRAPNANETVIDANTNLVEDVSDGNTYLYVANNDSLAKIHKLGASGTDLTYSNYNTIYNYPFVNGTTYTDTFSYVYMSNGSPINVEGQQVWKITGTGNLITPLKNYTNVSRVSKYTTRKYYIAGALNTTINSTTIAWYHPNSNQKLLQIANDDFFNQVEITFLNDTTSFLGLKNKNNETVKVSVYPNPVTNKLTFSTNVDEYYLVNINGKIIAKGSGISLNMSNYPVGIYFLKVVKNGNEQIIKINKT